MTSIREGHRFTEGQKIQMIDEDIRSRLIAMVSKKLDMETVARTITDEASQERIRWSLNWSRIVMGRLFLDFLGIRAELNSNKKGKVKPPGKVDVSVTDLGGRKEHGLTPAELDFLDSFMTHADKLVHFASHPDPPSEQDIDRAITLILKALNACLYEKTERPFPLSEDELNRIGLG